MKSGEKLQRNLSSEKDQPNCVYLLHSSVSGMQISSSNTWRIFVKDTVQGLVRLFQYNRYDFLSMPIFGWVRTVLARAHALKNVSVETPEVQTSRFGS